MPEYLTPGVYFETVDTGRRTVSPIRTDIAAFIGLAERGLLHRPLRLTTFEQFQSAFGGFIPQGYLAYAVKAFFENGGQVCYAVRVASETARPAWGDLLDQNGAPTLRLEASTPGAWGDRLAVRVARSSPAASRTADPASQPAGGESSVLASVAGFLVGSLVKVFQERPAQVEKYRIVVGIDPGRKRLIWDTPLAPDFQTNEPIFFETLEFSLSVYEAGRLREVFSGLSLVEQVSGRPNGRYVELVVNNGSRLIRLQDLQSASPFPARLPHPEAANLRDGVLALKAGKDGLADLRAADFTGRLSEAEKRGLRSLEDVDEVAILAVPDILIQPVLPVETAPLPTPETDPCLPDSIPQPEPLPLPESEQPPRFGLEDIFLVQQSLVAHCEDQRDRIALLDPPLFPQAGGAVDIGEIQTWRGRFESTYAAMYYPWVLVYDPLRLGGAAVRAVPPSGHVAGVFARTDLETGVHRAPANAELRWAQGVTHALSAALQGELNPVGVNCIRIFPGRGIRLYGARTVSSDPAWRYVNVRRLLMMIEEAVEEAIQWSVFEPINFVLRQALVQAIFSFLLALWERGALAGAVPDQAFFVKCDEENNPPSASELGQLIAEVGVAPTIPGEFVIFRIGRTEAELEITE